MLPSSWTTKLKAKPASGLMGEISVYTSSPEERLCMFLRETTWGLSSLPIYRTGLDSKLWRPLAQAEERRSETLEGYSTLGYKALLSLSTSSSVVVFTDVLLDPLST